MTDRTYRAGFLFCGLGAGARGFLQARANLGDHSARFESVGGIDIDAEACADFERLTGSPAVTADVATMTQAELRAAWGETAPDCVFLSPPCKGFSGLLSASSAAAPKYQALNRLVLQGLFLLCETWPDAPPPTIVLENVPRIVSRGAGLLVQVRELLLGYGYRLHEGQHDCGELGGLAQHRRRFLLVARREKAVPAFIHKPPVQRVRGCGEVLGNLPLPADPDAGILHGLPKLSWLTWVRLAMIPPGGDWRDLPGVLDEGQKRREKWARYDVRAWNQPARTVAGAGTNGGCAVADPRLVEVLSLKQTATGAASFKGRPGLYGVNAWAEPVPAVTGSASVTGSNAVAAVADPRTIEAAATLGCRPRAGTFGVLAWEQAAGAITGVAGVDNGRFAVADPRDVPDEPPVIRAADDTWHRPLTTLELAALQGLPPFLGGEPLKLAGRRSAAWRERIGNAVPVGAAKAIGGSILKSLLAGSLGTWTLDSGGIWVRQDGRTEHEWRAEA
jgi:site-specific DNA-cytosine methylase